MWQVSPQLSCGNSGQIWIWFGESNKYFCKILLMEKSMNRALETPTQGFTSSYTYQCNIGYRRIAFWCPHIHRCRHFDSPWCREGSAGYSSRPPTLGWEQNMTSSNGNILRVTGPLCGEFTGHRWIPLTKASDAELWCFLWSAPE